MYTIIRDEKLLIKSITVDNELEFKIMGIKQLIKYTKKIFKIKTLNLYFKVDSLM